MDRPDSDLCILLFMFLSLCRLCVCVFLCSHWSLGDVPLIFFCPADHVPDWQPRVLLGMVEARSVNVKKTTTTTVRCLRKYYEGVKLQTLFLYLFGVYCMFHQYSNHIQSENQKNENRKNQRYSGLYSI